MAPLIISAYPPVETGQVEKSSAKKKPPGKLGSTGGSL
jgi:hypothetical protein